MSDNVLKKVADTVLEEPIEIVFDIRPRNALHQLWQMVWPRARTEKRLLRPVTLGSLIKISKLLIDIDMTIFDMKDLLNSNYQAIAKHGMTAAEIVAIAIDGRKGNPPRDLVDLVVHNFTTKDLQATTRLIFGQMDVENFMLSIFSIKGTMQILEKSQLVQEESIAPGVLSAVS